MELSKRAKKRKWRRVLRRSHARFCIIYGLYDLCGNLRYIGQTRQMPEERLKWFHKQIDRAYARGKSLSPVLSWIDDCRYRNDPVEIKIIDANATWDVSEIIYIDRARGEGIELLNVLRGGQDTLAGLARAHCVTTPRRVITTTKSLPMDAVDGNPASAGIRGHSNCCE
jgi:hypothetical protein